MLIRDLYFSVRLDDLLKRAKVKGQLIRSRGFKEIQCSPEDEAWIEKKFNLLAEHGLVDAPEVAAGKSVNAAQKWFKQFLKKNAAKNAQAVDFVIVEKKQKVTLPQDYKDFIAMVGPKSFNDVNDLTSAIVSCSMFPSKAAIIRSIGIGTRRIRSNSSRQTSPSASSGLCKRTET